MADNYVDLSSPALGRVTTAMANHTLPYILAISREVSENEGEAWGTGTLLKLFEKTYILTNEHVASAMQTHSLGCILRNGELAMRINNPLLAWPDPVDAALSRIDDDLWADAEKEALPANRIARRYSSVPHEMLFIHGYPQEKTRPSSFVGGLHATSVPYLTQEASLPSDLDPNNYFALHYSPESAQSVKGRSSPLPQPKGFSGTLVWNTKYVESAGKDWSADQAVATGLICEWGEGHYANIILGVRIEIIRPFIVEALREEKAYFHWLNRGAPIPGNAIGDWIVAENAVRDLV